MSADDPSAAVLRRLKATKRKIPKLQFQLGQSARGGWRSKALLPAGQVHL